MAFLKYSVTRVGSFFGDVMRVGVAFFLFSLPAIGQVRVGLQVEHRVVMEGEPMVATIMLQNDSETPLVFNKIYHNATLEVNIRRGRVSGEPIFKTLDRNFVVMPDDSSKELVELTSLSNMQQPGSYQVWAQVRYDGNVYASRPQAFDVVHGIELASRQRHLPGYSDIRLTYSLRYCVRSGSEYAFLVVTDMQHKVSYGTFRLGTLVRVGAPAMDFDESGRMVVAHQSGRHRFTRSVISVHRDGAVFEDQTHHFPDGTPTTSGTGQSPEQASKTP